MERGFIARERGAERRCATQIADVLVAMENVTAAVTKAGAGAGDQAANEARKKILTALEQSCEQASAHARTGKLTCQAVTLYEGGQYFLYKYKRYDDVRLVFTPETDIAAFGGDPDNFQFPRWSLDFAILRAYEHGKPAKMSDYSKDQLRRTARRRARVRVGPPGIDLAPRDRRTARVRARPLAADDAAAHLRAARRIHPVQQRQPSRHAAGRGAPQQSRERHQGPAQASRRLARRFADGAQESRGGHAARARET